MPALQWREKMRATGGREAHRGNGGHGGREGISQFIPIIGQWEMVYMNGNHPLVTRKGIPYATIRA